MQWQGVVDQAGITYWVRPQRVTSAAAAATAVAAAAAAAAATGVLKLV